MSLFIVKFKDIKPGQKFWFHQNLDINQQRVAIKVSRDKPSDAYDGYVFEDEFKYKEVSLEMTVYVDKMPGWKEVNFSEVKVGGLFAITCTDDLNTHKIKVAVGNDAEYFAYSSNPHSVYSFSKNYSNKKVFVKESD